jgi:hypothetical protein
MGSKCARYKADQFDPTTHQDKQLKPFGMYPSPANGRKCVLKDMYLGKGSDGMPIATTQL